MAEPHRTPGRWIAVHVLAAVPDWADPDEVRERLLGAIANAAPAATTATYTDENGQAAMREVRFPEGRIHG